MNSCSDIIFALYGQFILQFCNVYSVCLARTMRKAIAIKKLIFLRPDYVLSLS